MSTQNKELAAIRELLFNRKRELEEKLAKMAKEKVTDDQVQDPGDQAVSSSMETLKSSLQNTELVEYRRIQRALAKIDDGTYGVCMDCSKPISEKRLTLFPDSTRCLMCQEKFEEQSKPFDIGA